MIVAFDATVLIYLFDRGAAPPLGRKSGKLVDRCAERLQHLIATLNRDKAKIVIPTPSENGGGKLDHGSGGIVLLRAA